MMIQPDFLLRRGMMKKSEILKFTTKTDEDLQEEV